MPNGDVSVSIVIVSYNSRDELNECLEAAVEKTAPYQSSTIVVDNASTDGTVDMLRASSCLTPLRESRSRMPATGVSIVTTSAL